MQSVQSLIEILICGLAVWRVTSLLVYEDGPFEIFVKLRAAAGVYDLGEDGKPSSFFGGLLNCFPCTSIWLAFPAAFLVHGTHWPLAWLAVSAVAVLLEERNGQGHD